MRVKGVGHCCRPLMGTMPTHTTERKPTIYEPFVIGNLSVTVAAIIFLNCTTDFLKNFVHGTLKIIEEV